MDNNEIMNNEEIEVMDEPIVAEGDNRSTGAAMLIGAGLAFAVGAGVKLGKKAVATIKAKVAAKKHEAESEIEPDDSEEE